MFIGMGMPIPDLANLPGVSRPGGGGGGDAGLADIDNLYSMDLLLIFITLLELKQGYMLMEVSVDCMQKARHPLKF